MNSSIKGLSSIVAQLRTVESIKHLGRRNLSSIGHHVYSWGTGDEGQLGHLSIVKSGISSTYVETTPKPIETLPKETGIVDISCGFTHCAAVTDAGEVFTWGSTEYGKLGHSEVTELAAEKGHKICMVPSKVYIEEPIKQVVCGEFHTAALSTSGNVYTWGWAGSNWGGIGCLGHAGTDSLDRPKKVDFADPSIKMTSISTGKYHMAAIGEEGEVWAWGRGEYGRNGNGGNGDQLTPEPIDYFLDCDISLKQISCGSNYTLALTDAGQIYGWGSNDHCQLGLGGGFAVDMFSMENFPKIVDALEDVKVVDISAGQQHSIAVTSSGEVHLWGMKLWMEPHLMSALAEQNIVSGSCGNNFSVVINDAGQMFSWGKGLFMRNAGCLGLGHTKRTVQPEMIEALASSPVQKVSCGNKSVLALSGLPSAL